MLTNNKVDLMTDFYWRGVCLVVVLVFYPTKPRKILVVLRVKALPYLGPVSRKSRKLFGLKKPFVELRAAYSVKLLFSYLVKGIKIKINAKFRASRRLHFEDTRRIMSPERHPKSFGTFE